MEGQAYQETSVACIQMEGTHIVSDFKDSVKHKNSVSLSNVDASRLKVFQDINALNNNKILEVDLELNQLVTSKNQPLLVLVPKIVEKRKRPDNIWYLLVDMEGQAYQGASVACIHMEGTQIVSDFKDSVKHKNSVSLSNVDASRLKVFQDINALNNNEILEVDLELNQLVTSKTQPLLVLVPEYGKSILNIVIPCDVSFNMEQIESYNQYMKVGKILSKSKQVKNLMNLISKLENRSFVFIDGSSGMGKTQMAFNLMNAYSDKRIFYAPVSPASESNQNIYSYFGNISTTMMDCANKDLELLRCNSKGSVYTLLDFDPLDLLSLQRSKLYLYTFINIWLKQKTIHNICASELCRSDSHPIAILDEFNIKSGNEDHLRLIRNVFRACGFIVITMGTESRAANLLKFANRSRPEEQPWCSIFTDLPPIEKQCLDLDLMNRLDLNIQSILLKSRPLFAHFALESKFQSLDDICDYVFSKSSSLKKPDEFLRGQILLPLNISYRSENADNWETPLIHHHFALLSDKESIIHLTNIGRCGDKKWYPSTIFPVPEQDLLLHLSFLGTNCLFGGSYLSKVAQFIEENRPSFINFKNSVQKSNDGNFLEALLTSCICISSHVGGFRGAYFKEVLKCLSFHLSNSNIQYHVKIEHLDLLNDFGNRLFPYLSVPNCKWPEFIRTYFPSFCNLERTTNNERVDFKTDAINGSIVSGEAKFRNTVVDLETMKNMIKRVPKTSWVHLILTTKLQKSYFQNKDFSLFRSEHELEHHYYLRMLINNDGTSKLFSVSGMPNEPKTYRCLVLFLECPHLK